MKKSLVKLSFAALLAVPLVGCSRNLSRSDVLGRYTANHVPFVSIHLTLNSDGTYDETAKVTRKTVLSDTGTWSFNSQAGSQITLHKAMIPTDAPGAPPHGLIRDEDWVLNISRFMNTVSMPITTVSNQGASGAMFIKVPPSAKSQASGPSLFSPPPQ
jgi:hypothetical protein